MDPRNIPGQTAKVTQPEASEQQSRHSEPQIQFL